MTAFVLSVSAALALLVFGAALQHGYGPWVTRNCRRLGRWADRLLPTDEEREFANFTAVGEDTAEAVEANEVGGVHGLLSMSQAYLAVLGGRCFAAAGGFVGAYLRGVTSKHGRRATGYQAAATVLITLWALGLIAWVAPRADFAFWFTAYSLPGLALLTHVWSQVRHGRWEATRSDR